MYTHIKICLCICRWMRPHGATRAGTQAPPLPTSIKPFYHAIFLDFVTRRTILRQSYDASHTRNGRGGACVPARTSAQRRFHTKIYLRITYYVCGFNDGCALAGRHGRAHRHRPYQPPSNPSATQLFCILLVGEPFAANHSARLLVGKLFSGNPFRWSTMRLKYCQLDVPKHGDSIEKAMKSR